MLRIVAAFLREQIASSSRIARDAKTKLAD
jgi:hypothetical protein